LLKFGFGKIIGLLFMGCVRPDYEQVSRSEFLPELDLALLVRCVLMHSIIEARTEFLNGVRQVG